MARTVYRVLPPRQDQLLARPTPVVLGSRTLLNNVGIYRLEGDGSELIMMPHEYEDRNDIGEDAEWRMNNDGNAERCWRTTKAYQSIGHHANLVRFVRPDPWTWLPVLVNPGGPNLGVFLKANRSEMYDNNSQQSDNGSSSAVDRSTAHSRVKATRLNLVYQWSIHLARALEFIHSYSFQSPAPIIAIVFGDLRAESCWLSSSGRSLSILGFQHAGFRTRSGPLHAGDMGLGGRGFQSQGRDPTLQTDLFLWGCVIYELMTGYWPGEGQGLGLEEQDFLVSRQEWPRLEAVYLGDVVRKCWTGEVTSAAELLGLVREAIAGLGVLVGDDDEIVDLSLEGLTIKLF